jgi:hypothetical protein
MAAKDGEEAEVPPMLRKSVLGSDGSQEVEPVGTRSASQIM